MNRQPDYDMPSSEEDDAEDSDDDGDDGEGGKDVRTEEESEEEEEEEEEPEELLQQRDYDMPDLESSGESGCEEILDTDLMNGDGSQEMNISSAQGSNARQENLDSMNVETGLSRNVKDERSTDQRTCLKEDDHICDERDIATECDGVSTGLTKLDMNS